MHLLIMHQEKKATIHKNTFIMAMLYIIGNSNLTKSGSLNKIKGINLPSFP